MRPSRPQPHAGDAARVVRLGGRREATIVEVDGPVVTVSCDGALLVFELNRLTGHFVKRGDPYYGTRIVLSA